MTAAICTVLLTVLRPRHVLLACFEHSSGILVGHDAREVA